jgi:GTP:adenosylcobinamide-phosphate guanylyltransferase
MDAIIVAGGIPGPDDPLFPLTQGRPKALLEVAGRPMLQWVVDAIEAASRVEHVFVLWPGPEREIHLGPRSTSIADQGGMVANILAGLKAVQRRDPASTHVLLSSGDIPGITPEMVNWRAQTVEAAHADFDYSVVERSVMDRVFPGSRRSFTPLKGIEVCGGDLNGLAVSVAGDEALWNKLYATRKSILKQASLLGYDLFVLAAMRQLTLDDAALRAGRRLGLKAHVTLCPYAEIGMDVDKPHQLEMVRDHLTARAAA